MASINAIKHHEGASARGGAPRLPVPVKIVPFEEYVNEGFSSDLVEGVIPQKSLVLFTGEDTEILLMDLMMHLAHGQHWHGQAVPRPRKVAFLPGRELGMERAWLREWMNAHGGAQRAELQILTGADPANLSTPELLPRLKAFAPELVAISLSEFAPPEASARAQTSERLIENLRILIAETGCSVLVADFLGNLALPNFPDFVDVHAAAESALFENQWLLELAFDHFKQTHNPVLDMTFSGEPVASYQGEGGKRRTVTVSMVSRVFVPFG